ncbi:MAG: hypothetical protein MJ060_04620 [Clostridia bacterium]|nr:hypothetical protein [Clostridia bacterium]
MAEKKLQKSTTKSVTVRGITLDVDVEVFDDMEVLQLFADLEDGNVFVFPRLMKLFFGDNYENITEQLKDKKTGRVKASTMGDFLKEVLTASGADAKN